MNFSSRLAAVLATLLCAPAASALSLQEAQRAMEAHNPDLRAAALELRGVQGDALTAALRPAAELSIGSSKISPKHGIGPGRWQDKRVDSTLGLGWTWERGGKRALRIRQADALLEVAGLDMLDTRRRQQVALHEAYFGLKGAQERAQIADANRQTSAEQMAAADKQVATGAMAPVDRARLAVDDLAVADAAREAALDLRDARHALGLLLGRDDSHDLSADDPWPDPAGRVDTGAFDPQQRADLRAARSRLAAADAGVALARSERQRDIQLGVEADRDSAALELQVLQREARAELDQLQASAQSAAQRRSDYEGLQSDAARKAVQGIELAYRRGAASLTDLLDARRSWRDFEAALIDARADHAIALARWEAATSVAEGESR
ncbi:TolC family protein [Stenotrophomonas maltophilia]|uniref:TolC family protein n=1 Tax=Stenotrophomonas TaxID=40323 RepID=UPI00066D9C15|nr:MULTISPECIES: TolC family protein [Stenotrophomonas]AWB78631.1 TolC family protein [Stenotrophomonas maltophilia]KOO70742.1 transporter [Stenotrophomonas maltophilia]MBH1583662.1 TolC family protein [Stenotrophomonas maltophilia]MBH1715778.1 TolC family protein [Stenotrophomonas maltophilia]MCR1820841.1 TolC family protein [Stenotrophomonas muris]